MRKRAFTHCSKTGPDEVWFSRLGQGEDENGGDLSEDRVEVAPAQERTNHG